MNMEDHKSIGEKEKAEARKNIEAVENILGNHPAVNKFMKDVGRTPKIVKEEKAYKLKRWAAKRGEGAYNHKLARLNETADTFQSNKLNMLMEAHKKFALEWAAANGVKGSNEQIIDKVLGMEDWHTRIFPNILKYKSKGIIN